jgi:hypothetical protein
MGGGGGGGISSACGTFSRHGVVKRFRQHGPQPTPAPTAGYPLPGYPAPVLDRPQNRSRLVRCRYSNSPQVTQV